MANVLFAVADKTALTAQETTFQSHLTSAGHTVTLMSQTEAVPAGTFKAAVLSASGTSANFSTKFTDLAYGVVTLNCGGMLSQLKMASTNSGTVSGTSTQWHLINTTHPVTSGLTDPATVYTAAQSNRGVVTANCASGVTALAQPVSDATRSTVVVAEAGATATSGTFAGRRVGLDVLAAGTVTGAGLTMFDQAVAWAVASAAPGLSVSASSSASTILTTGTATVTATPSGGSGTYTYAWTKTSGPAASFANTAVASTTFTPTGGAGTYVLRCTVNDGTNSAYAEVTVTVSAPSSYVTYSAITSSTGWTVTGSTALAAVTDASGATYVTSSSNASNQLFEGTLGALTAPTAGNPLSVIVDCDKLSASSGSIKADLVEGATVRSTVTISSIPNGTAGTDVAGQITINFPSADIASVTSWASLTLRLYATVAP